MTKKHGQIARGVLAVSLLTLGLACLGVAQDYESIVLDRLESSDLTPGEFDSARTSYSPSSDDFDDAASSVGEILAPTSTKNADGSIVVHNAKVEIPKGEGYEADISANGQGLLVELGLCEVDASGEVVVGEDGTSKRKLLKRGLVVRKGDVLGKQQDDELVQERIVAMQELLVARKEAEKTLEVEVAEAAARVAQASYKRADSLNKTMPGSVSPEEVQEKYYDWIRATKSIEKAKYDLEVNQEKVKVSEARVNAANVQIRNRKFRSPIDGIVDDVFQNEGQWLREGDLVLRIIRLDKVQVSGAISAGEYAPEDVDGKKVVVSARRPGMEPQELSGRIVYVRQVVESGHHYFYAEVDNKTTDAGYWLLNPGSLVTITILNEKAR